MFNISILFLEIKILGVGLQMKIENILLLFGTAKALFIKCNKNIGQRRFGKSLRNRVVIC